MFRLDTNPATLRVFEGEVLVASEGRSIKVGKGKRLPLGGTWTSAKFDVRQVDSFDRWNGRRAGLHSEGECARWEERPRADAACELLGSVRGEFPDTRHGQTAARPARALE